MKRSIAILFLALAGILTSVSIATAAPDPPTCESQSEYVRHLDLEVQAALEAKVALETSLDTALRAVLDLSSDVFPGDVKPSLGNLPDLLTGILGDGDLGEGGQAVVNAAIQAKVNLEAAIKLHADLVIKLRIARELQEKVCNPPTPTPTPQPPAFVDLDCDDFPLSDGRTAEDILRETPDVDEHHLDANANGIPCEPGVVDDDSDDVVPDTSSGIQTGMA